MTADTVDDLLDGSGPSDPIDRDDDGGGGDGGGDGGRVSTGRALWITLLVAAIVLGGAVGWRIGRSQGIWCWRSSASRGR